MMFDLSPLLTYTPALPEIILAVGAMALLMLGVFTSNEQQATARVNWLSMLVIAVAGVAVALQPDGTQRLFAGAFVVDAFARFLKILALAGAALAIFMSVDYMRREKIERFEFPVLILLATTGMLMMISANDLISLYLGLELQSLALYVLASIRRDSLRSSEAGLKYFVLGALSSGMLLYGASLIYGFTGTTQFNGIGEVLRQLNGANVGLIFGMVFLLAGLAFKISAVPFHMWTPDVYEGAPTPVTAFLAGAPKVAAMALLMRAMLGAMPAITSQWQQIIVFLAIASMVLGAFAGIGQRNIKRLMAYSSIANMGYALIGLAAARQDGTQAVLIYLAIYLVMTVGVFACILAMRRGDNMVEEIDQLAALSRTNLPMAFLLAMLLFSMAGIPPLAGFFGKFYVFLAAIRGELYVLAVIGVVASVIGAYYYLRIVKLMFFDEAAERFEPMPGRLQVVMTLSGLFVLLFALYPVPLVEAAERAAKSFF